MITTDCFGLQLEALFLNLFYFHGEYCQALTQSWCLGIFTIFENFFLSDIWLSFKWKFFEGRKRIEIYFTTYCFHITLEIAQICWFSFETYIKGGSVWLGRLSSVPCVWPGALHTPLKKKNHSNNFSFVFVFSWPGALHTPLKNKNHSNIFSFVIVFLWPGAIHTDPPKIAYHCQLVFAPIFLFVFVVLFEFVWTGAQSTDPGNMKLGVR